MSIFLICSAIEICAVFLFGVCLGKRPVMCAVISASCAVAVSYIIFGAWAIGPFEKTVGASVVGQEFMSAAIFAPEIEQGIKFDDKVPIPNHHDKQVLIQVKAAGLNPSNYKVSFAAIPFIRHLGKHVGGYDVSGKVISVGNDASCKVFNKGDEVYGFAVGSFAEYARAQCSLISHKPKSLSHVQAASLPVVAITSLEAFYRSGVKSGDKVLVIGASGGCGIYGITLGTKVFNAAVTGICSTKNVDFVKSLGASEVIDYKSDKDMKRLVDQGHQFDVVYDTVSSFDPVDPDYEPSMSPLLKANGRYIAINGWMLDWTREIVSKLTKPLFGWNIHRPGYELFLVEPSTKLLKTLANFFDNGKLAEVPIAKVYKLDSNSSLWAAFEQMRSRRTVGKIVFDMQ